MSSREADYDRNSFYLVQRLTRRDRPNVGGFDGVFGCQYMGSSEFEWGALPESLGRMRKAKRLGIHIGRVTRGDATVPVFIVGDLKRIPVVPDLLTEWLVDGYPRGKEMTYFPEAVTGDTKEWHTDTHAWWALNADVMWALDIDTAELLLKAVNAR